MYMYIYIYIYIYTLYTYLMYIPSSISENHVQTDTSLLHIELSYCLGK